MSWWILCIATFLGRPPWSVQQVYNEAEKQNVPPILACAVVEWESGFYIEMERPAYAGSTDFGWWQFNSLWHDQNRGSWRKRNEAGVAFLRVCLRRADGNERLALSYYHRWQLDRRGMDYADTVLRIRESCIQACLREVVRKASLTPPNLGMPLDRWQTVNKGDSHGKSVRW